MMAAKGIKRRIEAARKRVKREISANANSGGKYAAALAAEGYAGGYLDCLNDIDLLLNGVEPRRRDYWDIDSLGKEGP